MPGLYRGIRSVVSVEADTTDILWKMGMEKQWPCVISVHSNLSNQENISTFSVCTYPFTQIYVLGLTLLKKMDTLRELSSFTVQCQQNVLSYYSSVYCLCKTYLHRSHLIVCKGCPHGTRCKRQPGELQRLRLYEYVPA